MLNKINKFRRQLSRVLQNLWLLSKGHKVLAGLALVLVLGALISGVVWADHSADIRANELAKQQQEAKLAETQRLALEEQERAKQEQQDNESQQQEIAGAATQSSPEPKKDIKKYATSSDPRSTAYSTTPPAPNPASFSIRITHAGQLAYGDMVYYNATKGEKGFYGGDLVLSPSSVTISRSGSKWTPITVASHSGKNISMPSWPWYQTNPHFSIAFHGTTSSPAAPSHNMIVDTYSMPAVGTYKLHISSGCSDFGNDGCEAHGFITVNVVD